MSKQLALFGFSNSEVISKDMASSEMRVLIWNIANPSINRVYNQFNWLIKTKANVIILTEAKQSKGCLYLKDALESVGFKVYFPSPQNNDYCVIIAEKGFNSIEWPLNLSFLSHRLGSIVLKTFLGELKVMGIYVPSRGPKEKRNVNKRLFQDQVINLLHSLHQNKETINLIVGGDLNVIEPNHVPKYPIFGDWEYEFYNTFLRVGLVDADRLLNSNAQEYSWFGKFNDGYRFDHLFISKCFRGCLIKCYYIHEPRISKLSDHSAMVLILRKNKK